MVGVVNMCQSVMRAKVQYRDGIFLIALMLLMVLSACRSDPEKAAQVYDVIQDGKTYTVDQTNHTITEDGDVYRFSVSNNGNCVDFEVTYPDGSTYWWTESETAGAGGWSDDYDPNRYAAGDVLWDVLNLENQGNPQRSGGPIVLGIILILFGVVYAAFPRAMWFLSYGWHFKNAEPSDLALGIGRAGGVLAAVAGIICLLVFV